MKRICAAILTLLMAVAFAACVPASASAASAKVNNPNPQDRLNLRRQAGADSDSLGKYYNGTMVTILSSERAPWLYVSVGAEGLLRGYMDSGYLAMEGTQAYQNVASAMPEFSPGSTSWALYSRQSVQSEARMFGAGCVIQQMGFTSNWWHVRVVNADGNIYEGFIPAGSMQGVNTAVVNNPNPADRLNLRESPSGQAASIAKYYNGVTVEILSSAGDGGDNTWKWVRIMGTDVTGYMQTKFLRTDGKSVASAMPTVTIRNGGGTGLNLRADMSTKARSLGYYSNGTQVTVLGVSTDWLHVQVDGKVGFILADGVTPRIKFDLTK